LNNCPTLAPASSTPAEPSTKPVIIGVPSAKPNSRAAGRSDAAGDPVGLQHVGSRAAFAPTASHSSSLQPSSFNVR
jgi:hypothetical protein